MSETATIDVRRSEQRFHTNISWLKSHHSFSFGQHYDPDNTNHGLLVVSNDDVVRGGSGFQTHPHRDMEIVTWVLEGGVEHHDSEGNHGVIRPGLAQRMSAGRGVTQTDGGRTGLPAEDTRARVERAALDLFTLRGFENVTSDEVADAAGISRRTFFRHFPTKADAVWGDFAGHVARLEALLAAADPAPPFYVDKLNLLVLQDDSGKQMPISTPDQWRVRREHLLANMQLVMGEMPNSASSPDTETLPFCRSRSAISRLRSAGSTELLPVLMPARFRPGDACR